MASKLILDKSDPGVAEMVAAWKDGGTYKAEVEFRQDASSANTTDNTVTAIVNMSEEAPEEEEKPMEPAEEHTMPKRPRSGVMSKY